jgi:transcriptional regulator with XRE-family HTH domain
MGTLDIIKDLCKENKMSISGLEKKLGYGNASLSKAKNISSQRLIEIANFFHVSTDYLTGRSSDKRRVYTVDMSKLSDNIAKSYFNSKSKQNTSVYKNPPKPVKTIIIGKPSSKKDENNDIPFDYRIENGSFVITPKKDIHASLVDNDDPEIMKALDLYKKYQNASPEIQAAIETLLKTQSQES